MRRVTKTVLLTGMAVSVFSGLSGCVTVSGRPETGGIPASDAARDAPGAPPVDGAAGTVRSPPPLEGQSRPLPAGSRAAPGPGAAVSPGGASPEGAPPRGPAHGAPDGGTDAGADAGDPSAARERRASGTTARTPVRDRPPHPPQRRRAPRSDPAPPGAQAEGGTGDAAAVCELGERYGRWDPDSAPARVCRRAYG